MSLSTSPSTTQLTTIRTALPSAALVMALAISAVALTDAMIRGFHQGRSPIDEQQGIGWVNVTVTVVHAVGYAVLAGLLASQRDMVDAGSRVRRWIRRLLVVALAVLVALYGVISFVVDMEEQSPAVTVAGAVGGTAFAAMFVLSCALGISLLTRRELRPASWLLSAQLPLLALTLLLAATASPFAHPAYLEVASALGLALLGWPSRRPTAPTE
jgi:hypothetical protein